MFLKRRQKNEVPRCSFCEKTQDEVDTLISNPSNTSSRVYICNECVEVCNVVLEDHGQQKWAGAARASAN
jgi:ATP-dependent Clp protease ATP-binding subunit ClpX